LQKASGPYTHEKYDNPNLLKKHGRAPRVLITDKLKSYAAANRDPGLNVERRQHKGLNNRAENSHQLTRVREKVMRRFKSARHLQRFTSVHDQVANLFMHCRYNMNAQQKRQARKQAFRGMGSPDRNSNAGSSCRIMQQCLRSLSSLTRPSTT
jgi:putative transposase